MRATLKAQKPVIITLTQRAVAGEPLQQAYDRFVASWNRLRRTKTWKTTVRGHAAGIEVQRNVKQGWWHVHAHIVADADWFEQSELLELWRRSIGSDDEKEGGANIQRAKNNDYLAAAKEVAKYVVKGFSSSDDDDDDSTGAALDAMSDEEVGELLGWMRGTRLLRTYGEWRKTDIDQEPEGDGVADLDPEWESRGVVGFNALTGEEVHISELKKVPDNKLTDYQWGWLGDLYKRANETRERVGGGPLKPAFGRRKRRRRAEEGQ